MIPRRVAAAAAAYVLCLADWLRSVLADANWNRYGGLLYMCDPFGSCWDVFRAHCLSVRLHSHSHSHSHPHTLSLSLSLCVDRSSNVCTEYMSVGVGCSSHCAPGGFWPGAVSKFHNGFLLQLCTHKQLGKGV